MNNSKTQTKSAGERLKILQEIGGIGDWEIDLENFSIFWSDIIYDFYEIPKDKPPVDFEFDKQYFPEPYYSLLQETVRKAKEGHRQDGEFLSITPSGKHKWQYSVVIPVVENGKVVRLYGTLQDITERKGLERSVRHHEDRLRNVLDQYTESAIILTREFNITYANNSWRTHYAGTSETTAPLNFLSHLLISDKRVVEEELRKLFSGGMPQLVKEILLAREDGALRNMELTAYSITSPSSGDPEIAVILRDITLSKQQNDELASQKRFFESILDILPADVAIFDTQSRYLFVNHSAVRDTSFRESIIGKTDVEYYRMRNLPMEMAENRMAHHREALAKKTEVAFEELLVDRSGKKRNHLRRLKPILNDLGEVTYVIGYGIDITPLKESERQLMIQAAAIEATLDGIALLGPDEKYFYLNDAHLKLFGYSSSEELIGKTWRAIYPPSEIRRIEKEIFPVLIRDGYWKGETLGIKKDGTPVEQEISLSPLQGGGLVCICRDVSDRKTQEAELHMLAVVARNTNCLVIITDPEARIEWVNDAFAELTGYSSAEIVGKNASKLLSGPLTDPGTLEKIREAVKERKPFRGEILNYGKAGTPYWVYLTINPIFSENGELTKFISVENDITLIKEAEKNTQAALQKEKELSELKSQFISLASHEFRTPLASIQSSVDILEMLTSGIADPEVKSRIELHHQRIVEEISRIRDVMNNVFIVGKFDAGRMDYHPVAGDLEEFIRQVLRVESFHDARWGKVVVKTEGTPFLVEFDPQLFSHVVRNLIANSIKYTVNDAPPEILLRFTSDSVYMEVKDDGIGIPKKDQKKLFQSFYRASNTETIPGTGLGLVVVKRFTEMHKGIVRIESDLNQGCLVSVELPKKQTDAKAKNSNHRGRREVKRKHL